MTHTGSRTGPGSRRAPRRELPLLPLSLGALMVGLLLAVVAVRPGSPGPITPVVDARSQSPFASCLLTDQGGVGGAPASTVWAGLQEAAAITKTRANFLPVIGKPTTGNAIPYLNTLLAQHCAVIVAVGPAQTNAVSTAAAKHASTRFLLVGASGPASPNVTVIPAGDARRAARDSVVSAAGAR